MLWFHVRRREGVCDTPLHLFGDFTGIMMVVGYATSPTSGRMRYAPTLVRLISWVWWIGDLFRFRSFQGVCDTPLHLFGDFMGIMMVVEHAISLP